MPLLFVAVASPLRSKVTVTGSVWPEYPEIVIVCPLKSVT